MQAHGALRERGLRVSHRGAPVRGIRRCIRRFVAFRLRAAGRVRHLGGMKTLTSLLLWCVLFVLCWPLALLALVAWPLVWLLSLPFRLVGITFSALFSFLHAVLMLFSSS